MKSKAIWLSVGGTVLALVIVAIIFAITHKNGSSRAALYATRRRHTAVKGGDYR